ncbi:MFS general substrate transporter [Mollisia scopiformis]|uniref:MFS general substrate transporter n=1 Tax=Mollisia scopiformis TaxID=149040 RepID=A0A194XEV4_MOLSC|nr:MFS general substrate transporter [Mollisia scopiformis]KUJ18669.1 MFS general substrate transporter [Mollisia scopiformis]
MPLMEEDYENLRAEADAEPERYRSWDTQGQFRREYASLHPENQQVEKPENGNNSPLDENEIERLPTVVSTSSSGADSPQYEGIRARPATSRARSSSYAHDTDLHRSETHRINGQLVRNPTALDRINTHRSQHFGTVGSRASTKKDKPLPNFGGGKPYPPPLPAQEEYVVEFDGHDDPTHAQNWSLKKKLIISLIAIWASLAATFGSSIFSAASVGVEREFHVGIEVATLGTSLFVLGYAFGPIIWAPMSELYGRRLPIVISSFGFGIFAIGTATAANIQTVMICRFFDGLFGSCPLAVVAAIFADIWSNETRGMAVACFSATVFMGPLLAPFVGGFITESYLGWRWTMYISSFMGFSSFILSLFFLEETYPPLILVTKAAELRRRTKNWGIHAKQEEIEVDVKELIVKNVGRPLRILFTEPIVLLISIYMAFVYGLLYTFLTAYALVFQGVYHMNAGVGGLTYFGLVIGELIAFVMVILMNSSYVRKLKANNNIPVPEWRLPIVMIGGPVFAAGLFWFGWTGYTDKIPWIVPTLSGLFTGFGIFAIFLQLLNYIIDAYLMFAASAIAGNTFMRSLFGAIFPLFARYMYEGIGINYGQTLIGAVAAVLVPLPFIFYYYGRKIRGRSTFAPAPDIAQDKRRDEESSGESAQIDEGAQSEEKKAEES